MRSASFSWFWFSLGWYLQHPPPQDKCPVILLTNDVANRAAAVAEGLVALGVMAYCRAHRQDAKELQVGWWWWWWGYTH